MRVCDLSTGVGRMAHAFTKLKEQWGTIKSQWKDDASRHFEETHLKPIPPQMLFMQGAVQRLAEVVERAAKELDDRAEET